MGQCGICKRMEYMYIELSVGFSNRGLFRSPKISVFMKIGLFFSLKISKKGWVSSVKY